MIPELSIIIPTYKRYSELADCLHSLLIQNGNYELIIISDGFDKQTDEIIKNISSDHKNKSKQIIYLKQKNQGPATARNVGIVRARGKLITFLDDDCVVCKDWVKNIITAHKKNSKVLVIAGYIFPYDSTVLSEFNHCLDGLVDIKNNYYFYPSLINNVSYKKEVFKNINFNVNFKRAAGEDVEFNYKLYAHKIKTLFIQNILVKHRYKKTFYSFLCQQFTFGFERFHIMLVVNDYPFDKSNRFLYVLKRLATPLFDPWLRLIQAFKFKKKNKLLYLPIGYLQQGAYWSGFICAVLLDVSNRLFKSIKK